MSLRGLLLSVLLLLMLPSPLAGAGEGGGLCSLREARQRLLQTLTQRTESPTSSHEGPAVPLVRRRISQKGSGETSVKSSPSSHEAVTVPFEYRPDAVTVPMDYEFSGRTGGTVRMVPAQSLPAQNPSRTITVPADSGISQAKADRARAPRQKHETVHTSDLIPESHTWVHTSEMLPQTGVPSWEKTTPQGKVPSQHCCEPVSTRDPLRLERLGAGYQSAWHATEFSRPADPSSSDYPYRFSSDYRPSAEIEGLEISIPSVLGDAIQNKRVFSEFAPEVMDLESWIQNRLSKTKLNPNEVQITPAGEGGSQKVFFAHTPIPPYITSPELQKAWVNQHLIQALKIPKEAIANPSLPAAQIEAGLQRAAQSLYRAAVMEDLTQQLAEHVYYKPPGGERRRMIFVESTRDGVQSPVAGATARELSEATFGLLDSDTHRLKGNVPRRKAFEAILKAEGFTDAHGQVTAESVREAQAMLGIYELFMRKTHDVAIKYQINNGIAPVRNRMESVSSHEVSHVVGIDPAGGTNAKWDKKTRAWRIFDQ